MINCDSTSSTNPCDLTPLEDDLAKLRQHLIDSQKAQQTAEINIRQGEARIKTLETLIGQFNTIVDRYRGRYQQLKEKQDFLKKYCDDETACFEANLGQELAGKIISLSDELHANIDERFEKIKDKEEECKAKQSDLVQLKTDLDKASESMKQVSKFEEGIETRHKELDTLKQAIQTERTAHNHNFAYYLLKGKNKFCQKVAIDPKVVTAEELCTKLKEVWDALREIDEKYHAADAEAKACERELTTLKAQLEQDKRDLESLIRRRLDQLGNPPAKAAE